MKPSAAGVASKGVPHTSVLDRVHEEIRASEQRTRGQREMCSTGGDIPHQMGNNNVNIGNGSDIDDTPDTF